MYVEGVGAFAPVCAFLWSTCIALLLLGSATDVAHRIIPNKIIVGIAAMGITYTTIARPESLLLSILSAVCVLFGLGVFSHYKIVGGGDVKLITAVTFFVPPGHIARLLLAIALAGGVLSCTYLVARFYLKGGNNGGEICPGKVERSDGGFKAKLRAERMRIVAGNSLPYAVAVLGGMLIYSVKGFP